MAPKLILLATRYRRLQCTETTPWLKKGTLYSCPYLCQILTDFHNSFTDVLSWKFAIKLLIKIPLHLRCVATLPCSQIERLSASRWWFRSACQSWDALTYSSILAWKLTVATTVRCFWVNSCYLPYGRCLATSSCSNKRVHWRTGHARQLSCCNGRRPHSSHLICGLRIAQISTQ